MTDIRELFAVHCATSFARQIALSEVIGGKSRWNADLGKGLIMFEELCFPMQILGTRSEADNTWLWAWANKASNLPPALIAASLRIRAYGERHAVDEFTTAKLGLEHISDHELAMTCRGVVQGACYYRAPYEGGAMFVLLAGVPEAVEAPVTAERAVTVLSQCISQFELDHALLASSFLQQQGFDVRTADGCIWGTHPAGSEIKVSFNPQGLIANIEGTLKPQADPVARPWWKKW